MVERVTTKTISLEGGITENIPPIILGQNFAGNLLNGINFEPDPKGGYKRIKGYQKYDANAVPSTGTIKGVFVFNDKVIAARGQNIYESSGSGWSAALNSSLMNASATKYRGHTYNWGTPKIILVNSFDYPVRYDGTTFTHLTNSSFSKIPTDLAGAVAVASFKRHMFFIKGETLYFSGVGDETTFSPIDGGGAIPLGMTGTALHEWRNALYIFSKSSIKRLVGDNITNFVLEHVTSDLGLLNPDTVKEVDGNLVFLTKDGIRTLGGTDRIGDFNLENIARQAQSKILQLDLTSGSTEFNAVVLNKKNQYRLFSGNSTQARVDTKGILGGLRKRLDGQTQWEWFELEGIRAHTADSAILSTGTELVVHAEFDGFVYKQENGPDFDGNSVAARIQLPYLTLDDNEIRKTLYKLRLYTNSEGPVTPTLKYILDFLDSDRVQPPSITISSDTSGFTLWDDASAIWDTSVWDTTSQTITNFNLIGTCFNVSFIIESSDSNEPYTVETLTLQYGGGGRR